MRVIMNLPTKQDRLANLQYNMTLEEVGAELNLTRERVRQIQNAALKKIETNFPYTLILMQELADTLNARRRFETYGVLQ